MAALVLCAGCGSDSGDDASLPTAAGGLSTDTAATDEEDGADGPGVMPEGFTTIRAVITDDEGERCEVCLWLADSADERSQGLKGVTDLGDAVGMVFVYDGEVQYNFVMIDTVTPLSLAWFRDGGYVGGTDMEPCVEADDADCVRYGAGEPYTVAVEMLQGRLGTVGIGPGSTIELLADTESPACDPAA